jgi:stress-induced morphogen
MMIPRSLSKAECYSEPMFQPERLRSLIVARLPDAQVEVQDLTGTQDHYRVDVASAAFAGLSPLARHRLIYGTLGAHVGAEIHALTLGTHTPEEWSARAAMALPR